mmetsp:Transcript_14094/g.30116  ORF Transcript_14094/g.30116 Transcript_14094/m.30116 type:complete len:570 (-) Transcript_14094:77-1786(-)
MSKEDPIDNLLDQASSYAKKRLGDESFIDFKFTCTNTTSAAEILNGKNDLIEMREEKGVGLSGSGGGGLQRGMYAKCNIKAGTNLVIAKPLVVCWDVEDDDSDDEDDDLDALMKAHLGSDESGDEDDSAASDEDENTEMEATLEKFHNRLDGGGKMKANDEEQCKKPSASFKTAESDNENVSDDDDDDVSIHEATGTKRNGILILRSLEKLEKNPSLWTDTMSKLFPRDAETALSLPPWFCSDASIGMEIETKFSKLSALSLFPSKENEEVCKEIATRLPLIVRYNVLSVETCPELFVHPDVSKGGMASLSGTGLYGPEVSYFNHRCVPNVSRYCIGDVLFFVTNRDVTKGDELGYSYIEHEVLCENAAKRNALLDMDFELEDDSGGDGERPSKKQKVAKMPSAWKDEDEFIQPMICAEVQRELMGAPATERLELINDLLDQKADSVRDYKCDKFQLHILKAITLDGLGKSRQALLDWETAVEFATKNFPPLDETTIALRVQAAMCALNTGGKDAVNAKRHANEALKMHNSLFGGGNARFHKRYEKEFSCAMRPIPQATVTKNARELFS